jgi:hypothetical protein
LAFYAKASKAARAVSKHTLSQAHVPQVYIATLTGWRIAIQGGRRTSTSNMPRPSRIVFSQHTSMQLSQLAFAWRGITAGSDKEVPFNKGDA